ncbi:MAG: hypothetical protein LUO80_12280 [Methylococcaceae bacterium]|nr:hypothetical protein [Methylococcaceae bacterium]
MNTTQQRITGGCLTLLLFGSTSSHAGSCWVDIYDQPELAGSHVRIEGPAELPNLKALQGENWSNRIESLKVGPTTEVVAFKRENFNETHTGPLAHPDALKGASEAEIAAAHDLEISFGPGKHEHHLGEIKFHRSINSLKIRCR